ncbi:hypothetical protein ACT4UM_25970, partial [Bacillus sp. SS-TM]
CQFTKFRVIWFPSICFIKFLIPGGIIRDELGDVVDRYGRISNNPSWYQEFYKANGRKPNNTELRELAESHVRNGYQENGIDIPSWSPSSVKKIDEQIEQATALIKQNPSDQEALQPVINAHIITETIH